MYAAQHIFKKHGNAQVEEARGQKVVTGDDIARIPDIVVNYDEVRADLTDIKGTKQIAYAKKYDDGVLIYLESVSRKKKDFQAVTMWKYPPTSDAKKMLAANLDPKLNGQNREGAYENNNTIDNLNQGVRGLFHPDSRTIALLKGADLSTFQHELGHFMLEMNVDVAMQLQTRVGALTVEERLLVDDVNATMQWFGLKDMNEWQGLDSKARRSYHEQFARGFEAYLFEGKAPNMEKCGQYLTGWWPLRSRLKQRGNTII